MCSAAFAPAVPASGAAQRRRHYAEREREGLEIPLFGGRQCALATAVYYVEWAREYGPDPDDCRGYPVPAVTLCDLLAGSGASLLNAAGRRRCARIERQLEDHEAHAGPPEPYRFAHHYD